MSRLFRFTGALRRDPAVDAWLAGRPGALGDLARHWFGVMRDRGDDVRETMHDHHATACVGVAAFAYVAVFSSHVNVGFFRGVDLPDPAGLLEGGGKAMRHVKLRPGREVDAAALTDLVAAAHADVRERLAAES